MSEKPLIDYGKGKLPFRTALVRALETYDVKEGQGNTLVLAASNLIAQAVEGNANALRDIADRLDGKPAAELALTVDMAARPLTELTVEELETLIAEQQAVLGTKRAARSGGRIWNQKAGALTLDIASTEAEIDQ